MQILNGPSRTWLEGPPLPTNLAGHCALRNWDGLYIVGSSQEVLQVFLFNITSWRWSTLGKEGQLIAPKNEFEFLKTLNSTHVWRLLKGYSSYGKTDRNILTWISFFINVIDQK